MNINFLWQTNVSKLTSSKFSFDTSLCKQDFGRQREGAIIRMVL